MIDYKNIAIAFFSLVCVVLIPLQGKAQYIDFVINIEPEVTAQTEKALDFGSFLKNSGKNVASLGDVNMGVFSIAALEQQEMLITLSKPQALNHTNKDIKSVLPLDLMIRYGYSQNDYKDTKELADSLNSIFIQKKSSKATWTKIYIFLYGSIYIGDVPTGNYSNDLIMNIAFI